MIDNHSHQSFTTQRDPNSHLRLTLRSWQSSSYDVWVLFRWTSTHSLIRTGYLSWWISPPWCAYEIPGVVSLIYMRDRILVCPSCSSLLVHVWYPRIQRGSGVTVCMLVIDLLNSPSVKGLRRRLIAMGIKGDVVCIVFDQFWLVMRCCMEVGLWCGRCVDAAYSRWCSMSCASSGGDVDASRTRVL